MDDCIEWEGARNQDGYGHRWHNGRSEKAHRVAWMAVHGPIPEGFKVCHHCDNPPCINVRHLFLGTDKDNAEDRERKGRGHDRRGERNGRALLTPDEVREIRRRYAEGGISTLQLAREYRIGKSQMHNIVAGKSWPHL